MNKMNSNYKILTVLILIIILVIPSISFAEERTDGYFTVLIKETQEELFATARMINIGDKYLTSDNKLYEITTIDGDTGYAEFIEDIDLTGYNQSGIALSSLTPAQQENIIGIYHTHSAESYKPTDGTDSIEGGGGIIKVGAAMAKGIQRNGVKAIHNDQSNDPHDASAYQRSRRIAIELLEKGANAIVDVHRDSVPKAQYLGEVNGKTVAQIQFVVGRQNPQMQANDEFAKQLKAKADEMYPGLIKGIFYAKGSYNQELTPRATLVEVGTFENTREAAEETATMFSDVLTASLFGKGKKGAESSTETKPGGGSSRAVFWVLGLLLIGGGIFLFISMGGSKEMASKLPFLRKKK